MRAGVVGLALALALGAAHGQVRDPLTPVEADQLRDTAQQLDKRVELLVQFAGDRLAKFEAARTAARPAADRPAQLYGLLRQYAEILPELNDAMDDMAGAKKPDGKPAYKSEKVLAKVATAEQGFLATLHHIQASSAPADLASYRYELQNCLDATSDSLQNAKQDGGYSTPDSGRSRWSLGVGASFPGRGRPLGPERIQAAPAGPGADVSGRTP